MSSTDYNGWTNEATWRINLEIFSDVVWYDHVTVNDLEDLLEQYLFTHYYRSGSGGLLANYARAYVRQANLYEIAQYINEEIDLQR